MGKINLRALQVRKRALGNLQSQKLKTPPVWLDVVSEIPPAQILTRRQPNVHPQPILRTITSSREDRELVHHPPKQIVKTRGPMTPKRFYAPVNITYEEDKLRQQFFKDHPWELAHPRIVVETTGNSHKGTDFSKPLNQSRMQLSGEAVVQRQLHLLQTVPSITEEESYDVARREFYALRRQQATKRRIAKEEMLHMGATPEKDVLQWGMQVENKHYDDWERWAREELNVQLQRNSAMTGDIAPAPEQQLLEAATPVQGQQHGAFAVQERSQQRINSRPI